jgi:hypothetical protein
MDSLNSFAAFLIFAVFVAAAVTFVVGGALIVTEWLTSFWEDE